MSDTAPRPILLGGLLPPAATSCLVCGALLIAGSQFTVDGPFAPHAEAALRHYAWHTERNDGSPPSAEVMERLRDLVNATSEETG